VEDVGGTVVALQTVEVTIENNPVEDLAHGVGWVGLASDFKEFDDAKLNPLLCRKVLDKHVSCPATRFAMMCNADCTFVVIAHGRGACERKVNLGEKNSEVFDVFASVTACNCLGLCRREGSGALNAGIDKNGSSPEHGENAGYRVRFADDEETAI
jgi:hypothetical protein